MKINQLFTDPLLIISVLLVLLVVFMAGDNLGWERHASFSKKIECQYKRVVELPAWCLEYLD